MRLLNFNVQKSIKLTVLPYLIVKSITLITIILSNILSNYDRLSESIRSEKFFV